MYISLKRKDVNGESIAFNQTTSSCVLIIILDLKPRSRLKADLIIKIREMVLNNFCFFIHAFWAVP